jgi:hypothetical protein
LVAKLGWFEVLGWRGLAEVLGGGAVDQTSVPPIITPPQPNPRLRLRPPTLPCMICTAP